MGKVRKGKNQFLRSKQNLDNYTLTAIVEMMVDAKFPHALIQELSSAFEKRIASSSEKAFQTWFSNLLYQIPEEFSNEQDCIRIFEAYHNWFEQEIEKLETETALSWQEQTADIASLSDKARKSQLVIRHRLGEIQLDLVD